jgi:hypothetical protein
MAMLELESNLKSDGIRGASHHKMAGEGKGGGAARPSLAMFVNSALNAHVGR